MAGLVGDSSAKASATATYLLTVRSISVDRSRLMAAGPSSVHATLARASRARRGGTPGEAGGEGCCGGAPSAGGLGPHDASRRSMQMDDALPSNYTHRDILGPPVPAAGSHAPG